MVQAFSRLKRVLNEQNMTVPELHRACGGGGCTSTSKASTDSTTTGNRCNVWTFAWPAPSARSSPCPCRT
jgi:hypothetical protein